MTAARAFALVRGQHHHVRRARISAPKDVAVEIVQEVGSEVIVPGTHRVREICRSEADGLVTVTGRAHSLYVQELGLTLRWVEEA